MDEADISGRKARNPRRGGPYHIERSSIIRDSVDMGTILRPVEDIPSTEGPGDHNTAHYSRVQEDHESLDYQI